jgi:hypothetical protein
MRMANKPIVVTLVSLAIVQLAGCNVPASRVGENASEGWVTRLVSAAEMKNLPSGCAEGVDLSALGSDQFVKVRKPHGRLAVTVYAHVPRGMQVHTGMRSKSNPPGARTA